MKKPEVVFKNSSPMPYRIYYMSKDGITLGGTPIGGKFPWKYTQSLARGILRHWARDLVAEHDTAQLGTILHRWAKDWSADWSAENDVNGTGPAISENSALESILTRLRDHSTQRKMHFKRDYNNRDASIMYHLSKEMVKAVSYCLKRADVNLKIQWEIQSLPNDMGIYRILSEGGEHHES